MPWIPELFSAPALERIRSEARGALAAVPYFQGLMSGETDALVGSFAGEPELHHPVRGRVKGRRAFERVRRPRPTPGWPSATPRSRTSSASSRRGAASRRRSWPSTASDGRIELPVAIAADRDEHARIIELRVYFSTWPLTGRHAEPPAGAAAGPRPPRARRGRRVPARARGR